MKKIFKIFSILIILDFIFTAILFKNTQYWINSNQDDIWWRTSSSDYHHKILPNINKMEKWGGVLKTKLITNSLGFRDKEIRLIKKDNKKQKRLLLIGDSFIEGSGLNYEDTVAGNLDVFLGEKYEILNSAVGSYSPSIYYKKTKFYLDKGYKFDKALIFLDLSDIMDELFIKFNDQGEILTAQVAKKQHIHKKLFYSLGRFLRDNTVLFRFFSILSDKTEITKNYLKLKYKASVELKKNFLNVKRDDVMFYKMTHIDRGFWTFNDEEFSKVQKGLKQSEIYLEKLFNLLKNNNIKSTLIVYPWPTQIYYGDNYHENYWRKFSNENEINFLSIYDVFLENEDLKNFIFENFIYGDIHWNIKGNKLVSKKIIESIEF